MFIFGNLVDISPILVILAIIFIQRFLIATLMDIGNKIKGGAVI